MTMEVEDPGGIQARNRARFGRNIESMLTDEFGIVLRRMECHSCWCCGKAAHNCGSKEDVTETTILH